METTATQGTSIAVLAPYLPYGIEVQTPDYTGFLLALIKSDFDNDFVAQVSIAHTWNGYKTRLCLPVLRSFADLPAPLADGTVPAIEVAKLLSNDWAARYSYEVEEAKGNRVTVRLMQWDHEEGETLVGEISILADWNFFLEDMGEIMGFENVLEAYTYLRSQHFAVGLEPHQYIRKPADPATPATREEVGA